jgi:cathepsin B
MKVFIGLILITLAVFVSSSGDHFVTREKLEALKSVATFDVINYENHPFKELTKEQVIKKLGLMRHLNKKSQPVVYGEPSNDLPKSFHYKEKWPECFHPIRDQQQCGSCWAFAASEVLSDRFCIATNSQVNIVMSPQDLVSCDSNDYGCDGGYVDKSWDYIRDKGIVSDECLPYTSGSGSSGTCPFGKSKKCVKGVFKKYRVESHQQYETIADAKETIFNEGPIEAAFDVYDDFINYQGGVYRRISEGYLGGHAVKAVGWGVDTDGTEYWVVANSWNITWGEQGFFRIAFGECGFEDSLWAGKPQVDAEVLDNFLY